MQKMLFTEYLENNQENASARTLLEYYNNNIQTLQREIELEKTTETDDICPLQDYISLEQVYQVTCKRIDDNQMVKRMEAEVNKDLHIFVLSKPAFEAALRGQIDNIIRFLSLR